MEETYNGYEGFGDRDSAWATWNAALWMDNEESIYRDRRRRMGMLYTDDRVKEFFMEYFPTGTPDMDPGDVNQVNWSEILESWEAEDE